MAEFRTLEGSATYHERIALNPEAVLEVELRDVSRADAPAPLLAAVAVKPGKAIPIPFKLLYDDGMIDPRHTYAVSARVRLKDRVAFRNTTAHLVLTRNNPDRVEVMMEAMPASSETMDIFAAEWVAEDIGGGGVIDNARSTITFAADGSAHGSGGCNSFRGKAAVDGDRIDIGPLAATRKACVPALGDQERKFFDALERARSFAIDEQSMKLVLMDGNGMELVRFHGSSGRAN